MSKRKWIIVDANYLCYRSFFAMRDLMWQGQLTGVVFGFLKEVSQLQDLHNADGFVFCFDSRKSKRRMMYPKYKSTRRKLAREKPKKERKQKKELYRQIEELREKHLPALGFKNIFCQKGYEADDLIAKVAEDLDRETEKGIIVTSDEDLYQCLRSNVFIWNPAKHRAYNKKSFTDEYGIEPAAWAMVKAIGGCKGDDVKGVKGVGDKTAAKYLSGKLDLQSKIGKKIVKKHTKWKRNIALVTLPLHGTQKMKLRRDKVTSKKWRRVAKSMGMSSIESLAPIADGRF